jgi:hypothetical protein
MKAVDVLTEDESVGIGNDFGKYVVDLFEEDYFSVVQWIQKLHESMTDL